MSFALNKVMLAGNLTRDPQTRAVGSGGSTVCNFGLAINRKFKSNGETREEVTFVDVECWGKTGELVAQYLSKGRGAYVEGRLKLDTWQDKEGQKRSKLTVVADNVQFIGPKGETPTAEVEVAAAPPSRPAPVTTPSEDEPPFN
jgi:single-strand DNA-binding protein